MVWRETEIVKRDRTEERGDDDDGHYRDERAKRLKNVTLKCKHKWGEEEAELGGGVGTWQTDRRPH